MNAIIVGVDGRPSMIDMIRTFPFQSQVTMFTYRRKLGNYKTTWYSMNPGDKSFMKIDNPPSFSKGDKVVMWGTRIPLNYGDAIVYNHPNFTKNASDKKIARKIFEEKNISAPKLVQNDELYKTRYPVIIRKHIHRAGIGFHIAHNDMQALNFIEKLDGAGYYISEIYPKTAEFRVHCAMGKALLVKQKPTPEDKSVVAWNFHQVEQPWTTIARKDYNFNMIKLALDSIEAVGIDYGAVDIMSYPSKEGYPEHVIAEINTAPSYTPYLITKYGAFFDLAFKADGKLEKWDYSKFKKPISFSWKNKQLNALK